jgi:hypothetical protein
MLKVLGYARTGPSTALGETENGYSNCAACSNLLRSKIGELLLLGTQFFEKVPGFCCSAPGGRRNFSVARQVQPRSVSLI